MGREPIRAVRTVLPRATNNPAATRAPWFGRSPAHGRARCPAKDQMCRKCNKRGHFQVVCRSAMNVRGLQTGVDNYDSAFLGAVGQEGDRNDVWTITLSLEGKPVTLHIDTGAEVTVITERMWKRVGQPKMSTPDKTLRGPDSHTITTLGKFTGTFTLGARQTKGEIYVARGLSRSLLGRPAISDLELIKRIATVDQGALS